MRKILPPFLLLFTFLAGQGQESVQRITKNYFRSDPFLTSFGSFVQHLVNDPDIHEKKMELRSDTTLFYFEGQYARFNPFFTRPEKVQVALSEISINLSDSLPADTIFVYQLIAENASSREGIQQIRKEFEKIRKFAGNRFPSSTHSTDPLAGMQGEQYNYFLPYYALAPFSLGWYEDAASKRVMLILTVRMRQEENEARLVF